MTESEENDRLLTVKQVAEFFQVTTYTVREWLKDEQHPITGTKFGKSWRIKWSVVTDYAERKFGEGK